ncbi:hypothetical protein Ct61P_15046 [Colletotrichum tofieldiae]|nr:hypothetical protein Ct61P_15046 [Colletotrichum tofieldiae]
MGYYDEVYYVARSGYEKSHSTYGEDHPLTTRFYNLAKSSSTEITIRESLNIWLTESNVTETHVYPKDSILATAVRRFGHDHITTLRVMGSLALIELFSGIENLESCETLLQRARNLAKNAAVIYGQPSYIQVRIWIALIMGLAANFVASHNGESSSQFRETAIVDLIDLNQDAYDVFGPRRIALEGIIILSRSLYDAGEYRNVIKEVIHVLRLRTSLLGNRKISL